MCDCCAENIKQNCFNPMVIQGCEAIRGVETMMDGVEMLVEIFVGMEKSVTEILPCIKDEST